MFNANLTNQNESKKASIATPLLALSCVGLLALGMVSFTGCGGGESSTSKEEGKKESLLKMSVVEVDQLSSLESKVPDGQYLVARVTMKNNSNETIVLDPTSFSLQNITDNEKDQYSQPAEKGLTNVFGKAYGVELKDKLMDYDSANLYPRMQIERYFVFMVPSDAMVNGYQITYKPTKLSIPLITPEVTVINDHRTTEANTDTNDIEPEPSKP